MWLLMTTAKDVGWSEWDRQTSMLLWWSFLLWFCPCRVDGGPVYPQQRRTKEYQGASSQKPEGEHGGSHPCVSQMPTSCTLCAAPVILHLVVIHGIQAVFLSQPHVFILSFSSFLLRMHVLKMIEARMWYAYWNLRSISLMLFENV